MNLTKAIPAGSYFAFIRSDEQDLRVRSDEDGRAQRAETQVVQVAQPYSVHEFEFSPTGERLFCTLKDIRRGPDDVVLAVCDSDGGVRLHDGYTQIFASWLQDGSHLLVRSLSSASDRASVALLDVATDSVIQLETPADMFVKHDLYDPEFLVSFKRLDSDERAVVYLDSNGEEVELCREQHEIRELRFSPDRTKVAYFYGYPYHKWIQGWRIVVVDVATRGRTTVFDAVAESIFQLRWGPDSRGLSFVCGMSGIPDNRLMDMDLYETMGGFAPDLMGNSYGAFSMKMDGSERRQIVRDCWKFDWVGLSDFAPCAIEA